MIAIASNAVKLSFVVDSAQARRELHRVQGSLRDVEHTGTRTGNRLHSALGIGLRAGATAAAGALGGLAFGAYKAIGAASDLSESINKTNVVFGRSSREIQSWARGAATNMGISQVAAQDAAAGFAVFGSAAGLTGQKLVKFSEPLVQAAADMASFHNADPSDTLEAIRSGLAGEAEPLRRYGILLNEATLRQEALKLGLVDTTKNALTPQQRALAAQHVILGQLGPATGDFARTSSGLANQQRILRARFEDLTAHLGQKLLPVANKVAEWANDLLDFFTKIADAPSVDVAAKIVWTSVSDVVSDLWARIGEEITGATTTQRRYDVEAHRLVTFTRHDPGLLDDFMDALGSIFEGGTTTRRRYSTTLHRLITVERDDPSLAEQIASGLGKAIRDAARGIASSRNRHAWDQSFGDLTDKTINPWLDRQANAFNRWDDRISNQFRHWFRGSLRRVWNIGFSDITGTANTGLDRLAKKFDVKLPPITQTVQGWGSDVHHAVTNKLGSIPGAVGRIWDSVRSGIDNKWQSITNTISGWVHTALSPVNSVLDFLGLDPITIGAAHHHRAPNPPRGASGAVPQAATGGYLVRARPGGQLLVSDKGSPFIAGEAGHDELVLTTDRRHKKRTVQLVHDLLNKLGEPPQYGIGGWIQDELRSGANAVGGAVSGVASAASGLADALLHPAAWIKAHLPSIPSADSAAGQLVTGVLNHVKDALIAAVTGVVGASGGATVQRALAEARRIDALNLPYVWGGGHQSSPAPRNGPFDCSGFVSHILQYAGIHIPTMTSGAMMGIGSPGRGAGLEVLANPNHVYMKIGAGGFYGTSSYNPGGGPGKLPYGERSGFTIRHFAKGTRSAPEGWAWVGEEGPELRHLRAGDSIMSHRDSMRAVESGKSVHVTIHQHFHTDPNPDKIRRAKREAIRGLERGLVGVVA